MLNVSKAVLGKALWNSFVAQVLFLLIRRLHNQHVAGGGGGSHKGAIFVSH